MLGTYCTMRPPCGEWRSPVGDSESPVVAGRTSAHYDSAILGGGKQDTYTEIMDASSIHNLSRCKETNRKRSIINS